MDEELNRLRIVVREQDATLTALKAAVLALAHAHPHSDAFVDRYRHIVEETLARALHTALPDEDIAATQRATIAFATELRQAVWAGKQQRP